MLNGHTVAKSQPLAGGRRSFCGGIQREVQDMGLFAHHFKAARLLVSAVATKGDGDRVEGIIDY